MKKSLLALAALTAFAGAASAQSSVTLFGILDLAATSVDNANAGTLRTLSPSGNATSRLGLRDVEDLGGGLTAGFWLEGELAPDVGGGIHTAPGTTANAMNWQRRATVQIAGNFGEVRMGRDYTPTFSNISTYDAWGYVGVSTLANIRAAALNSKAGTAVRASNAVEYFLPSLGGLYGNVMVAAGEGSLGNKYVGGRLGYAAGPLNVSAAYGKTYKTCINGTMTCMVDDLKTANVGASFNAGFLQVMAGFEKSDYSTATQKLATAAVLVPFGASTLKLSITSTTGGVAGNNAYKAKVYGLGYQYDLSKRTALYAQYGRVSNGSGATFTASDSGNSGIAAGQTSTGYQFGMRHNF
ncbi:MAG: porin [Burkholderiales bacterium]|nr:porin [Burkholderiales bacterium]MDE1927773.1 porin [Burkholderiales bacterium]MDE2160256.1 porin [Burkholderiales bacterium]MDE2504037.1 porin [Burkholderiales bacterium]